MTKQPKRSLKIFFVSVILIFVIGIYLEFVICDLVFACSLCLVSLKLHFMLHPEHVGFFGTGDGFFP
jgi:hypothetical protein